jgi:hypothetical protein
MDAYVSECKNFRNGLDMSILINQGGGTLQLRAGPYVSPSSCDRSNNGLMRAADIQVAIYKTNGANNPGFSIKSYPGMRPLYGNTITIDVPNGTLDPTLLRTMTTTMVGKLYFNNEYMGDVTLGADGWKIVF